MENLKKKFALYWKEINIFLKNNNVEILLVFIVLLLSIITRFYRLNEPRHLVFDENYFIPMAEKYKDGEFYGDPHPPLGRLVITFGSVLFDGQAEKRIEGDVIRYEVDNFIPYRFFPALFGAFLPLIVYFIVRVTTKSKTLAFLTSFLLIFENTLVVHSQYALFDSILMFFSLLSTFLGLLFIQIVPNKKVFSKRNLFVRFGLLSLMGLSLGAAVSTKLSGLSALFPIFLLLLFKTFKDKYKLNFKTVFFLLLQIFCVIVFALFVFALSYSVHFSLFSKKGEDFEEFSYEYQECIIDNNKCSMTLYDRIRESLDWSFGYEDAVPTIDFCKEGEMGSLPYQWPFMSRAIPYSFTNHGKIPLEEVSYVYLTGNPVVWTLALLGLVFALGLASSSIFYLRSFVNKSILFFSLVYLANFLPYIRIYRVMYFYHYFLAFIYSIILLAVLIKRFDFINRGNGLLNKFRKIIFPFILIITLLGFAVYIPLTYNIKIDVDFVKKIIITDFINLKVDPYNYNR